MGIYGAVGTGGSIVAKTKSLCIWTVVPSTVFAAGEEGRNDSRRCV